eukprot:6186874-Pleurochrysis_carterae.AAC.2
MEQERRFQGAHKKSAGFSETSGSGSRSGLHCTAAVPAPPRAGTTMPWLQYRVHRAYELAAKPRAGPALLTCSVVPTCTAVVVYVPSFAPPPYSLSLPSNIAVKHASVRALVSVGVGAPPTPASKASAGVLRGCLRRATTPGRLPRAQRPGHPRRQRRGRRAPPRRRSSGASPPRAPSARRQLDAGLVVVLGARQRREARALAGRVVEGDRGACRQLGLEVDAARLRLGARLCKRVERPETVARAAVPVLVHREHRRGRARHLLDGVLEPCLPASCKLRAAAQCESAQRRAQSAGARTQNAVRAENTSSWAKELGTDASRGLAACPQPATVAA